MRKIPGFQPKTVKTKTLFEQMKEAPMIRRQFSGTIDTDAAIAWLKDELALHQISRILWPDSKIGNTSTQCYLFLSRSLREAYRQGRIKIVK